LQRTGWSSTEPIRTIFRQAFEAANLPYFNPHSFRDTLVQYGERNSPNIEVFKAWSLNLGHANIGTTLNSYGSMSANRQAELIRNFEISKPSDAVNPAALALMKAAIAAMDKQA
jgi:integrase